MSKIIFSFAVQLAWNAPKYSTSIKTAVKIYKGHKFLLSSVEN